MIAVVALLVARRAMVGVAELRAREARGTDRSAAVRPVGPAAPDDVRNDYRTGRLPPEVAGAWLQFLRDDVAEAANGLNNRLQVIDALRRELADDARIAPEQRHRLVELERELQRAADLTRGLLKRVSALAPDTLPMSVDRWQDDPVAPGHILLVEDDEANRAVVGRLFERFGHRVTAVSNGLEAFRILEERHGAVDCIVCDVRMPALGGRGFFEQIEELWPSLARRFVFVTGDYTRPDSREFLDRTGQPVIGKPFEVTELMNAVRVTLARAMS